MTYANPLPMIFALLVAIGTVFLINRRTETPNSQGRLTSIDGLRGYLAFFVFLHHSCIYFFYIKTGEWTIPPSKLYRHFGQSSVAIFFMVTGFFLCSKLIDKDTKPIDWERLFICRIFRIMPMYFFSISIVFLVVAYLSDFRVKEPLSEVLVNIFRWITLLGSPDINGIERTSIIIGKVTWYLTYDCLFYSIFPILALIVGEKPPIRYLLVGLVGLLCLTLIHPQIHHLMSFFGGMVSAIVSRHLIFRNSRHYLLASTILLLISAVILYSFPSTSGVIQIILLTIIFSIIASGNTLFGLLSSGISRSFGSISYSLYLMHGILLYFTFSLIIGIPEAKELPLTTYWLIIIFITPILIAISFITHHFIEIPSMRFAQNLFYKESIQR